MILMKNDMGRLGWGMAARVEGNIDSHSDPDMIYYYFNEFQFEFKNCADVFFPLAYSDVSNNSENIVWHFNNFESLTELKCVPFNSSNSFDNVGIYKVFKKLSKVYKKLTPKKDAAYCKQFSLLLVLNNFVSAPELSAMSRLEGEEFIKAVAVMQRLRKTQHNDFPVAVAAVEYLKLPDMYLESLLG